MGLAYGSRSLGDRGYPKGCYVYSGDGKAYFNPHSIGGVDPQRQPLCVRSLNAPGAAPSGGALPRRCTCTCSLALASRCMACMRAARKLGAKGRVHSGDAMYIHVPTENLAHRRDCAAGPMQTSDA
jgi:hypothetical protein